tara:strand:- start:382 stop:600 length:219 start_codon:yes stop_codon:yes gene_type:complete
MTKIEETVVDSLTASQSEIETRFNTNLSKAQQIEQQITGLQEQLRSLQQPLIEDQGAIKEIKKILNQVNETN